MTDKTLGQIILTDFEAARPILEAWARGEPLEWNNGHVWTVKRYDPQVLHVRNHYRIPPRPHTVDWSQVGERIVAFKTLAHGGHVAVTDSGNGLPSDYWPSFRPGTMPWQESRIERPKEVK